MSHSTVLRLLPLLAICSVRARYTSPQDYLAQFGYLKVDPAAAVDTEQFLSNGLLKFQDYHGLPLTGIADATTVELMSTARCGVPDLEPVKSHQRNKRYALAGRWRKRSLKYVISQYSNNVTHDNINSVIGSAFKLWESAADITLNKVEKEKEADLVVSFVKGSHSTNRTTHVDGKLSFDGPGGVLAHASFPSVGEIHFDDAEKWLVDNAKSEGELGYNLMWAAVHELGHALGLKHTNIRGNVMNPVYKKQAIHDLGEDDITGIVRLYGTPKEKVTVQSNEVHTTSPKQGNYQNDTVTCQEGNEATDAVLTLGKKMYMFRGSQVWEFSNSTSRPHFPAPISSVFPGITGPVTAAMAGINHKIYFFRNRYYWRWDAVKKTVDQGFPRNVAGFGYIYDDIIAAFRWDHNGKGYLFGKCRYWRYDFWKKRADPGYPRSTRTWRGVPDELDDITTGPDGKTYIFKNQNYWVYSSEYYRMLPQTHNKHDKWKTCPEPDENMSTEQELTVSELRSDSYADTSNATRSTALSILLYLATLILL